MLALLAAHHQQWQRRCFALVLIALLLYLSADFSPIMHLTLLSQTRNETVWSDLKATCQG